MKILNVQNYQQYKTFVAFTGEFDKYSFISERIIQERIKNQKRSYDYERSSIDSQIQKENNKLASLKGQIRGLERAIDNNDYKISILKQESEQILNDINQKKEKIDFLTKDNVKLVEDYLQTKQNIDNETEQKKILGLKDIQESFSCKIEQMKQGPKNILIEKMINPLLIAYTLEEEPPNHLLINTETLNDTERMDVKKSIFDWIKVKSNVNFAKLNVDKFSNFNEFINLLKKISLSSEQEFQKTGDMTVTLIENLDKLKITEIEESNKEFLKKLWEKGSSFYRNVLLVFVNSKPQAFKNSFHINIDKKFINDTRCGLNSFIREIQNKNPKGINLIKRIGK